MSAPPADEIGNLNSILRSICGRTPTGMSTACIHDHHGEATGIYQLVKIGVLRGLLGHKGSLTPDVLTDMADEIQAELTP